MSELFLAKQLMAIDTSTQTGVERATDLIAGWLSARGVGIREVRLGNRRCLRATVGTGTTRVLFNGHIDVVPGSPSQFIPVERDGRLYGRGAYDMKGALAAMALAVAECATRPLRNVELELMIVPDEETSGPGPNCTELLVADGLRADFVICGEPTDLHVGVQAKGIVMVCAHVPGVSVHGSTPWLGKNAVLRAMDFYSQVTAMPCFRESSELFSQPSVNLGRIAGGDALNCVPESCQVWIDIRTLPGQDRAEILAQLRAIDPEVEIELLLDKPAAVVPHTDPMVERLLRAGRVAAPNAQPVGRHGSSDAIPFLAVGVPAVEFGPIGAGHHGADEYVEIDSLQAYRTALVEFVRDLNGDTDEVIWPQI